MRYCKICQADKPLKGRRICLSCLNKQNRDKIKQKLAIKKLRLEIKKKKKREKKLNDPKRLHKQAWILQGQWLKKQRANFQGYAECFTCFKLFPVKELEQGHRHHGKLDFDLRNIHLQCVRCNHYLSGNLGIYERRLIETNGLEYAKQLEAEANQHKGYSVDELKELIKRYET